MSVRRKIALLIWFSSIVCTVLVRAQEQSPSTTEPANSAERALTDQTGAEPEPEHGRDCQNGYTATMCTGENTKFLGAFEATCLIAIPGIFALAIPLFLGTGRSQTSWWVN